MIQRCGACGLYWTLIFVLKGLGACDSGTVLGLQRFKGACVSPAVPQHTGEPCCTWAHPDEHVPRWGHNKCSQDVCGVCKSQISQFYSADILCSIFYMLTWYVSLCVSSGKTTFGGSGHSPGYLWICQRWKSTSDIWHRCEFTLPLVSCTYTYFCTNLLKIRVIVDSLLNIVSLIVIIVIITTILLCYLQYSHKGLVQLTQLI